MTNRCSERYTAVAEKGPRVNRRGFSCCGLLGLAPILAIVPQAEAQGLEGEGLPEFDIWIPLDNVRKDRI